jgi:hypothetical protein
MSTETPVATATVNGVVATSAMTSQQIFNAHLAAQGGTPVDFKAGARSGPPLHVHADSTGGLADAQATAAKAPPTPKQLERQNAMPPQGTPAATRQAEFDADMQAKGLQRRPDGSTHAEGEVDHDSVAKLTESYKYWYGRQGTEEKRQELRASYERDLKRIHNGRPLTELELTISTGEVVAKMRGGKEVKARETPAPAPTDTVAALLAEYAKLPAGSKTPAVARDYDVAIMKNVANAHGRAHVSRFNANSLSGYKLPDFLGKEHGGQHYPAEIIYDLARARAAGLTQAQVDAFVRDDMVAGGWVKA